MSAASRIAFFSLMMMMKPLQPPSGASQVYGSLVSWWSFDTTLADAHGENVLSGTAAYVGTSTGQRANPSTALKTAGVIPALNTKNFSIGGRFTFPAAGAYFNFLTHRTSGGLQYERVQLGRSISGIISFGINPFATAKYVSSILAYGAETVSILATYDGENIVLYINGELQGTTPATAEIATGANYFELGYSYDGNYTTDFDELFVCNVALDSDAATLLHNGGAGLSYQGLLDSLDSGPMTIIEAFPDVFVGIPYDKTVMITGAYITPVAVDLLDGAIPAGLTLEIDPTGTKARLHGTATPVMEIPATLLPAAIYGVYYSARIKVVNAVGNVTPDIFSGNFPAWASLAWHSATQEIEIYGTPT